MIDYKNNLISITNSILAYYNVKPHHHTNPILDQVLHLNYKHVIVILLDGMGMNILKNLDENTLLRKNVKMALSSVFPPTTVAATNAFLAGKTPYETGFLGWTQYNLFEDATDTIFLKTDYYTNKPINDNLYDRMLPLNFLEQIKEKNPKLHIESIFPKPINQSNYETFDEQLDRLLMITKGNESLTYCYYHEPDTTIHTNGIHGLKTKEVLKKLNESLTAFKESISDDVLTIVVADHGLVDVNYLYLEDYQEIYQTFYRLPSIESRAMSFFIKPDQTNQFLELFNTHFQPGFKLLTKQELLESNLLGQGLKHPLLDSFLGEYIAISTSNKVIAINREETPFKAHHAGLTEDELMIPLIILK